MKNRKLLLSVTVPFLLLLAACNKTPATTVAPTTAPVTATPIPTTVPATPTPTPIEENNEDTPLVLFFPRQAVSTTSHSFSPCLPKKGLKYSLLRMVRTLVLPAMPVFILRESPFMTIQTNRMYIVRLKIFP